MRSSTRKAWLMLGGLVCSTIVIGALLERARFALLSQAVGIDVHLVLSRVLFYVGGQPVRVWFLIKATLYLAFLYLVSRLSRVFVESLTRTNRNFDDHRRYVLSRLLSVAIYTLGIVIGANVENINFKTMVILGGTLGVGVGFGLQSLVSNLIAGLILLVEQPIRLGDRIEFDNRTGEVVRVGTRSSWIRTYDNAVLILPNSEFVTKPILNWTAGDPKVRLVLPVQVACSNDTGKVMSLLMQAACEHAEALQEPAPSVVLESLGPNSISFALRLWTMTSPSDFPRLRTELYLKVIASFRREAIELPLPQLDLHLKNLPCTGDVKSRELTDCLG